MITANRSELTATSDLVSFPVASIVPDLFRRTLVLAPHPDDACFLYGLLWKLRQGGCDIHIEVATCGDHYQPHAGRVVDAQQRFEEEQRAARHLGIDFVPVRFPGQDAHLDALPQFEIVRWIEESIADFQPTALLVPVPSHHQDHRAVFEASLTALRPGASAGVRLAALYEYPCSAVWPPVYAPPLSGRIVVDISAGGLEVKLKALAEHASQVRGRSPNHPLHPDSIRKLAALRGVEIGVDYAEVLYPLRIVL